MNKRQKTRRQRYYDKKSHAKTYPIGICCVNFMHDGNLGYVIRSAACFGANAIHVIGSIPTRSILNPLSGTLCDFVKIKQYKNPSEFLDYTRSNSIRLVSAEICEGSTPLSAYSFDHTSPIIVVVGNEESGIPVEILLNSDKVMIEMPGVGYCLNTSQTANIILYESIKQYNNG